MNDNTHQQHNKEKDSDNNSYNNFYINNNMTTTTEEELMDIVLEQIPIDNNNNENNNNKKDEVENAGLEDNYSINNNKEIENNEMIIHQKSTVEMNEDNNILNNNTNKQMNNNDNNNNNTATIHELLEKSLSPTNSIHTNDSSLGLSTNNEITSIGEIYQQQPLQEDHFKSSPNTITGFNNNTNYYNNNSNKNSLEIQRQQYHDYNDVGSTIDCGSVTLQIPHDDHKVETEIFDDESEEDEELEDSIETTKKENTLNIDPSIQEQQQNKSDNNDKSLYLCFSGGGIRSASFQLGVLEVIEGKKALNKIHTISSVSGGGYTASSLISHWYWNSSEKGIVKKLKRQMRENVNFLMGTPLKVLQVVSSVIIGVLHNIIFGLALSLLLASFIYSGFVTKGFPVPPNTTLNQTSREEVDVYNEYSRKMSDYEGINYIPYLLCFYRLDTDIRNGTYVSSIVQQEYGFVLVIVVISVIVLTAFGVVLFNYIRKCFKTTKRYYKLLRIDREPNIYSSPQNVNNGGTSVFDNHSSDSDGEENYPEEGSIEYKVQTIAFKLINIFSRIFLIVIIIILLLEILKLLIFGIGNLIVITGFNNFFVIIIVCWVLLYLVGLFFAILMKFSPLWSPAMVFFFLLNPLIFLIFTAGFSLWYMYDVPIFPFSSTTGNSRMISILECVSWCFFIVELSFSDILDSAIANIYKTALQTSFYYKGRNIKMKSLAKEQGLPKLVINCTVNNFRSFRNFDLSIGDNFQPFYFEQGNASGPLFLKRKTAWNQEGLADAMALSGAAFSIRMGFYEKQIGIGVLARLFLNTISLNIGQWTRFFTSDYEKVMAYTMKIILYTLHVIFPISGLFKAINDISKFSDFPIAIITWTSFLAIWIVLDGFLLTLSYFTPIPNFLLEIPLLRSLHLILGIRQTEKDNYFFLSDGGHFENLGAFECFRRNNEEADQSKVKTIIAFDAEADSQLKMNALYHLLNISRECGIIKKASFIDDDAKSIDNLIESKIKSSPLERSKNNFVRIKVTYCKHKTTGIIWYGKATVLGNENGMIKLYQVGDNEFPHTSTLNQFFSKDVMDAYRRLGKKVASDIFNDMKQFGVTV
ncbi:hypothetical protein ABK040_011738 [Willaertia magna]